MKIFNPSRNLILATTIFLVFIVPLRAQDSPQDFLDAHNQARAAVGVDPLAWDETVAAYAQDYANQRRGDCAFPMERTSLQENMNIATTIFCIAWSSGDMSGVEAVNMWVSEQADYDYGSNTCASGKQCGHYTQIVWKNSVRLGCAKVSCDNGQTFITCNYDPQGNFVGQWPY
ncbi:unnamed protein product [Brassica rapa]|uniref:Pathogenesis-related protein 1 n=1 Tax=Brassica campestris TaxID=3711 RepID=A0A3P6A301_BRACM|nr:unnamed protein product [Brassica rapa]VDC84049.1 unnamed protein product [Brassica rapa]